MPICLTMMKAESSYGGRFIITSFSFIVFLCILASINEIRFDSLLNFGRCAFSQPPHNPFATNYSLLVSSLSKFRQEFSVHSSDINDIRILIGILTLPDHYDRRHFLRLVYGTQSTAGAKIDVKFVFCNLTKEDQKVLVALEIMRYHDIMILNCKENMNNGKTYTYFSSLPEIFKSADGPNRDGPHPPYHYVMKADDDSYFRLESLAQSLRSLPRQDLYYGFVIPCSSRDPFVHYMSGMGYLVSWDIVEWISESDIPKQHSEGPEDKVFGKWLSNGGRGKNRYNAKWSMYNFPEPITKCSHELWPGTVGVHLLKTREKWVRTLKYFNVTKNMKPSKLYHL